MRLTAIQRRLVVCLFLCIALFLYLRSPAYLPSDIASLPSTVFTSSHTDISPSALHNSTANPDILSFWKEWAETIDAAKPQAPPVHIDGGASNIPAPEDAHAHRKKPNSHTRLRETQVASLKAAHEQYRSELDNLEAENAAEEIYEGTGVVTVAGGEYFGPAIVGIKMLRQTSSVLPVEVFLADWTEYEPEVCEIVLPALNAKCIVLEDYLKPRIEEGAEEEMRDFAISHYQLKALALLLSSFQHVLYLDSDSIVLVEPEKELFDQEPYISTGFVGWPDFWSASEEPRFYEIAGLAPEGFPTNLPAASSEAGQILIDKARHLKTLLLATYYNIWGPDYFYPLLSQGAMGQGDKETFTTATFVLNQPYYRVKTAVKAIGRSIKGEFRGSAMIQWHPGDDFYKFEGLAKRQVNKPLGSVRKGIRPAFVHSNTPKMNSGHLVDEGDLKDDWTSESLRLWGLLSEQRTIFGEDLEKRVWEVVVDVGCQLESVLKDWKHRKNLCKRLWEHWRDVFE